MALPEGANEWELLQDTIRRTENKKILEFFRDLGGEDWEPDLSTRESTLRHVCTHKDDDSAIMTLMRMWVFYFGMLSNAPFKTEQQIIYGMPSTTFHSTWRTHPEVKLYFSEDSDDVEPGYDPIWGEISYRLLNETAQTISMAQASQIGTRIMQNFGASGGYRWHKGWHKCTYLDKERGYDFRLLIFDRAEGERIIRDVLDLNNDTYRGSLFQYAEKGNPSEAFPTEPGNTTILGKVQKRPRRRARAYVRFRYAHLFLHGLTKPLLIASNIPGIPADVN